MSEPDGNAPRRGWTLALTSAAFFMVALDALVVTTALPVMGRDLHAGMAALQWTVNAYGLAYTAGIITAAALGDRFGRRRVFTAGLTVFTLASAGCAVAPSVGWLLAARTVQGIGAAAVMPLSLTILTGAFGPARRGAIIGIWGGLGGLAVAGGPLIGGAVTEGLDWQAIFWLNVPIGVAAVALSRARLPESHGPQAGLDLPALALFSGGAAALVWGLVRAGVSGWGAPVTLGALGCGALLVAGFAAWEARAATPLLIAPAAGRISDRTGRRPVLAAGMGLQAAGLAWFALAAGAAPRYAALVAPLLVAGVGISLALPAAATAAISAVRPDQLGKASGANSTLQRLGGVFGVAAATTVFTAAGRLGTAATSTAGFRPALAAAAGLSLLGALTALTLRPAPRPRQTTFEPATTPIPDPACASR